jgi:hypothetical protein
MKRFVFVKPAAPVFSKPLSANGEAEYDTPFENETAEFDSPFKDEANPPVLKKPTVDIVKKRPAKFGN